MFTIDLNCDMGEGCGHDGLIMPFISSANIACGYHAGDEQTIRRTVELCQEHHVAIGAHPSFNDRENFGRTEMHFSAQEVFHLITEQLNFFSKIASHIKLHHVKPHGALYNMAARDSSLAAAIANAVLDFDGSLVLYGLAGSHSISEARKAGLKTASEVFADRHYQDDGTLSPRQQPNALIESTDESLAQVLQIIKEKSVMSMTGKRITVPAETICIHGDGKNAVAFAKTIHQYLKQEMIEIKTI